MKKQRNVYLDVLRILACFCVIFIHTGDRGIYLYAMYAPNDMRYWGYMFVSLLALFPIPMFLSVSGSLLIKKEETIATVYKKRILRIGLILLLFSFLYYLWEVLYEKSQVLSIKTFLSVFLTKDWNFSFWYLYMFLGYLASLPLLRALAKALQRKHWYYLFGCFSFFNILLPIAEVLWMKNISTFNQYFSMTWISESMFIFPLLGYFLENEINIVKAKKWIVPMWFVDLVFLGISCFLTYYKSLFAHEDVIPEELIKNYFSIFHVTTVFITVKYLMQNGAKRRFAKISSSVGETTFGIYLLHIFVMIKLPYIEVLWNKISAIPYMNSMASSFIICFIVFVICYAITVVLKKIPVLKKLL